MGGAPTEGPAEGARIGNGARRGKLKSNWLRVTGPSNGHRKIRGKGQEKLQYRSWIPNRDMRRRFEGP